MADRPAAPTFATHPGPTSSATWWVSHGQAPPVGPVTTELLLSGIRAGVVPRESLICKVGYRQWQALADVAPFADEVTKPRGRFDPSSERCRLDIEPLPASSPRATRFR
jgi:hypothetical protein